MHVRRISRTNRDPYQDKDRPLGLVCEWINSGWNSKLVQGTSTPG
jgi:hypothetical protein